MHSTIAPPRLSDFTQHLAEQQASLDAARWIKCLLRHHGAVMDAVASFESAYPGAIHRSFIVQKAAVAPGTRTDGTWAGPLAIRTPLTDAVVALSRAQSVLGGIPYRDVPANITIGVQTVGAVAGWVGEAGTKRVSKQGYALAAVDPCKVAAIVVLSAELVKLISPASDAVVRNDLVEQIAAAVDGELLDQTRAPVAGVHPGSILNGITPIAPSGTDATAAAKDIDRTIIDFLTKTAATAQTRLLLSQTTALLVKSVRPLEPLTVNGGSYAGVPAVVSENVGNRIVVVDGGQLLVADDGATIDASRHTTIQLDDNPDSPATAATVQMPLWPGNAIGIKGDRYISWKLAKSSAVSWCGPTAYVP